MFRSGLFLFSTVWLGLSAPLHACQVPVFRYALERWWPDKYKLLVVHKGDLTPELSSLLDPYADAPDLANLKIEIINLNEADPADLKRYHGLGEISGTPALLLYYPDAPRGEPALFSAPFTKSALEQIVDSPARRQIASQILRGDSAVWVILDPGSDLGDSEEVRLREGLKNIASYMELPEGVITPDEADELMAQARAGEAPPPGFDAENILNYGVPLRIGFSVVRIDTRSVEESAFVRILLASNPDLDPAAGPVAIPIFGRGRMLQGLPVKTLLDEDILPDACYYICGACSCQVKGQNPGLDLLMKVDWEGTLQGHTVVVEKELPPLSGAGDIVAAGLDKSDPVPSVKITSPTTVTPTPINGQGTGESGPPSPVPNPDSKVDQEGPASVFSSVYLGVAVSVGLAVVGIGIGSFLVLRRHQK